MNTDLARRQMVQQQVRTWDVSDADVLRVISELRREQFVPAGYEDLAFADTEIPLPHGQAMMKPIVEGRLLQALELEPRHFGALSGLGLVHLARENFMKARAAFEASLLIYPQSRATQRNIELVDNYIRRNSA